MPELTEEPSDDLIRPFQIDRLAIRGRLVRLGPALDGIIGRHAYPEPVARLLGQAAALAAMLAGGLKYQGVFSLQTKGDGPVRLLVADVTSEGALRAYAQFDADAVEAASAASGAELPRLLGAGYLAFTVDQGDATERYQGIVALEGATLADCVHHYFRQSEQIETGVTVAAEHLPGAGWRAGGIMLQRMPAEGGDDEAEEAGERDDAWRAALLLLGSSSEHELTAPDLAGDTLLYRLFHERGIRVYAPQALADRCRCSRGRIETVLRSLPDADLAALGDDRRTVVTCEFCSAHYIFSDEEIAALRGASAGSSDG